MIYDSKATADSRGRLYYFDNAKFILIFLVVLAHFVASLNDTSPFCRALWGVINYFHMPALIFISGFFAKRYISKSREIKVQRVATYVILMAAATLFYALFQTFALDLPFRPSMMSARPAMWFLQCLIAWHVMLPVLSYFKPGYVMAASIVLGLLVGYQNGASHFMSISRMFVHLPFFMAGYYIKQEHIDKLNKKIFKWMGAGAFAAVAAISYILPFTVIESLLTSRAPYAKLKILVAHIPEPLFWTARLWFYGVAAALIVAFLALVPRGKAIFTNLGQETLSVYILHIPLYLAYRQFKWFTLFQSPGMLALLVLLALALTVVFSLKPFTLPFHWLQKIKVDKMMKRSG